MSSFFSGSLNPRNIVDTVKYKKKFNKEHPNYFKPSGLLTFCGGQGTGKTLSAVQYITKVLKKYPKAVLVTNVEIKGITNNVVYYTNLQELINMFDIVKNGEYGVIYFVDEIQVLFNALMRRNMDVRTLEAISQQRKQRKHIVGTAQVFMRIDKTFREQMEYVVFCRKVFGVVQVNQFVDAQKSTEVDGILKYDVERSYIWFHSPKLYELYDTSKVISAYRKEFENNVFDFSALKNQLEQAKKDEEEAKKNGIRFTVSH